MENPEKLATQDTQDEEKQNKNTIEYVLDTTIRNQICFLSSITAKTFSGLDCIYE
jgi:hypothetical protein